MLEPDRERRYCRTCMNRLSCTTRSKVKQQQRNINHSEKHKLNSPLTHQEKKRAKKA